MWMSLSEFEEKFNYIINLVKSGNVKEALITINRCIRRIDQYIQRASGPERLKALILLRKFGQLQTKISDKQMRKISEDEEE